MSLSKEEIERRVGLLKRLKETLLKQREKFHTYMAVLEAEKNSIQEDQIDRLQSQVAIEENLVVEIRNFQKVIDPLEDVFQQAYPHEKDAEVEQIKLSLENLKTQVLEKNKQNRSLLSSRMAEVRGEILRAKPRAKSLYNSGSQTSTLVDITT